MLYLFYVPFCETETRNAICLAFLNACDSAVAPLDDLAQLAELDLNGQLRDRCMNSFTLGEPSFLPGQA